jgi:4-hydroxybenzoate polyprenyltransferase
MRKVLQLLQMIKFEHSVFALPFAVTSALYAQPDPQAGPIAWILLAMVSARSAAMAFNRIVDAAIDARNPRTQERHLPRRIISSREAWVFLVAMIGVFFVSAAMLNRTCLYCSPGVLGILLGYSLTKRFTWLCHFVLGVSLGLAPVGAWIAIREAAEPFPILLGTAVVFWVAGFDIIYATLDTDFDRKEGLKSVPARFGVRGALVISALCHLMCGGALVALYFVSGLGKIYLGGLGVILAVLAYEHWIVRPSDLGRANTAFFHVNVLVSLGLMCSLLLDLYLGRNT